MKVLLDKLNNHTYPERHLFHGKSCAVVGNSSKLLGDKLGDEIDSHDFIIRFNHGRVKGFESYVGTKTNLRLINIHMVAAINGYDISENMKIFSKFSPDIFKELDDTNYLAQLDTNLHKVRLLYPEITFNHISNETQNFLSGSLKLQPTSGFIGIILALVHFENVSCYGFDFYGGDNDHYFEDVIKYNRNHHSLDKEKEFVYYLNDNKLLNYK
jgi:hypothetical protein